MRKRLLLHTCCAPCLSGSLDPLLGRSPWQRVLPSPPDYEVTLFFYNPNISPEEERDKRKYEVKRLAQIYGLDFIEGKNDSEQWEARAVKLADEPEGGKRCLFCYRWRLAETFRVAERLDFQLVATTLTLSPLKNAQAINQIGQTLALRFKVDYLATDFKKQNGFLRSIKLSKELGLYRQNYCGCRFSR